MVNYIVRFKEDSLSNLLFVEVLIENALPKGDKDYFYATYKLVN